LEQTFNASEIFLEDVILNAYDSSLYSIEEIRSLALGRCYMICSKETDRIAIKIRKERDIKGICHAPTLVIVCTKKVRRRSFFLIVKSENNIGRSIVNYVKSYQW
jgi:hypothetical protein